MGAWRRHRFVLGLLLCVVVAAMLRLPSLDERPMHTDEAVHAYKTEQLRRGDYEYDPADFHGPTLYYAARLGMMLTGVTSWREATEADHRSIPALFGIALVALVGAFARGLGRSACLVAAGLLALSPMMTYYSRYYIQEMLLVSFTAAFLALAYRSVRHPNLGVTLAAGACAGAMYATKETAAFAFVAMVGAWFVAWRWRRRSPERAAGAAPRRRLIGHVVAAFIAGLFVAGHLLSGFGLRANGIAESFASFRLQGTSGVHEHAWHFYLSMLAWSRFSGGPVWTEAIVFALAVVGAVAAVRGRAPAGDAWFQRFVVGYAVLLTGIYCAIPHKTPWSFASAWFAWILLAGLGASSFIARTRPMRARAAVIVGLVAAAAHLGVQSQRSAFRYAADSRNPYVYAHTSTDLVRLSDRVHALTRVSDAGVDTRIDVIVAGDDYWPLPWYFRDLNPARIGYWSAPSPEGTPAPIVIGGLGLGAAGRARLGADRHVSIFGLRPAVLLELSVAASLWKRFLGPRVPERRAAAETEPMRCHHRAMATTFSIAFPPSAVRSEERRAYARRAAQAAFGVVDRLERQMSRYREDSEVSEVNRAAGEAVWTVVSPAMFRCLREAARFARETDRAFDAGIGHLRAGASDQAALEAAGIRHLRFDQGRVAVRLESAGARLDLGGIGKGFAVDRVAALLGEWALAGALVEGGHSSVRALSDDADPGWPVTLADPRTPERPFLRLRLRHRAMGASGSARGRPILDPRTGQAVRHHVASWVLASTATEADALSTACMVWRAPEIAAFCAERPDVAAIVIRRRDRAILSFGDVGRGAPLRGPGSDATLRPWNPADESPVPPR